MPKRLCLTCFNTAVDIQAFVDSGINFQKTTIRQLFPGAKVEEAFNSPFVAESGAVPEHPESGSVPQFVEQDTFTDDLAERQSQGILNCSVGENESKVASQETINVQNHHSRLWQGKEGISNQNHLTESYNSPQKVYNTNICVSENEQCISLTENEQSISLTESDNGISVTENDQCAFPAENEKRISLTENDQGITVTESQQCITSVENEKSIILTENYQGISVAAAEQDNSPPKCLVKNPQQNRLNEALPVPVHPSHKVPIETAKTECSLDEETMEKVVTDKQDNSGTDSIVSKQRSKDTDSSQTSESQTLPASLKILEPRSRSKKCPTCKKTFSRQSHLKSHLASHSTARPFECPVCSIRFKYRRNLVEHSGIHHSCPSFICSMCGLTFKQKSK